MRSAWMTVAALAWPVFGFAQVQSQQSEVVTDEFGTYVVSDLATGGNGGFGTADVGVQWTSHDAIAICQSIAIGHGTTSVWAGQALNSERLQRFDFSSVIPTFEVTAGTTSPSIVAAADQADLGLFLDYTGTQFVLSAYSAAGGSPLWTFSFPSSYNSSGYNNLDVSHDGSIVACSVYDSVALSSNVHFFDGASGDLIGNWNAATFIGGVRVSGDGTRAITTEGSTGRVLDLSTFTEIFNAPGSGAGGTHQINDDGTVIGLGGFDLDVYKWDGATYVKTVDYTAPTSWFGWGLSISGDGNYVGVYAHNYLGYLERTFRVFDANTGALLASDVHTGTGTFQGSIFGAAANTEGSIFAVCSWGTQDDLTPEVLIYDRDAVRIGEIDTDGSPFYLAMSENGQWLGVGTKAVHANTFGNGGDAILYQVFEDSADPCPADLNDDGLIDLTDLATLLANFGSAGTPDQGDIDGNGTIDLTDLSLLLSVFGSECPQ